MIKSASNHKLKDLNTFGLKARAAKYIRYDAPEDLPGIEWDAIPKPVLPLGQGSNLLFTADFPGTVLHSQIKGIHVLEERRDGDDVFVHAGAGVVWDDLCAWAARKGFWGPENLSGIPGTVGAAPVQNVGAYGVEAADIIDSVECFDIPARKFVVLTPQECTWDYRDSVFKHNRGRYIVTGVVFHFRTDFTPRLEYGNLREEIERNVKLCQTSSDPYNPLLGAHPGVQLPVRPQLVRDTVKIIRECKLPNPAKVGSAGSFFKNPVVSAGAYEKVLAVVRSSRGESSQVPHFDLPDGSVKVPAAFLIEFCGLKGAECGGAALWQNQPLVLVNVRGKASADDILSLEKKIVDKVEAVFGISLVPEVDHI